MTSFVYPLDIPASTSALPPTDIPSMSTSAPPPADTVHASGYVPVDPSVAMMGHMSVLIE